MTQAQPAKDGISMVINSDTSTETQKNYPITKGSTETIKHITLPNGEKGVEYGGGRYFFAEGKLFRTKRRVYGVIPKPDKPFHPRDDVRSHIR